MKKKPKSEVKMQKVRVLQGCSIHVAGIWHNQGTVLFVEDPAAFTRTTLDDKGRSQTRPCVELVEDGAEVNVPEGLLPAAVEAAPTPNPPTVSEPRSEEEV
jgi:hypothetical protein